LERVSSWPGHGPLSAESRPAFYALRPGGWRDLVTLLHPPYTAWHLSYVLLGAAAAPSIDHARVVWTVLAFFLAVGVGAHALDELHGRPLGTRLSDRTLIVLAGGGLGAAAVIGLVGAVVVSWWIVILVAAGVWLTVAYNLELVGGRFHNDLWFALAWGAFPALVGYVVNAGCLEWTGVVVAAGCAALSAAQRALSTPVRRLRRHTDALDGVQRLDDGTHLDLSIDTAAAPLDRALLALSAGIVLLALGLIAARW
jgi:hypothetical protein